MSEAIYNVGDVLEIPKNVALPMQFGMLYEDDILKCLVVKCTRPWYDFTIYTLLIDAPEGFKIVGVNQKDILDSAKRVGHIELGPFVDRDWKEPENKFGIFANDDWIKLMAIAKGLEAREAKTELEALKTRATRNLRQIGFTSKAIEDILEGKHDLGDGCFTDKC